MIKIIFVAAALLSQPLFAAECSPRPGSPNLDLAQIMYHFGKASRLVKSMAEKGLVTPTEVSVQELNESFAAVENANACTDVILAADGSNTHILPVRFGEMSADEQREFLEKFKALAQEFKDTLKEIGTLCQALLGNPSHVDYWKMQELEGKLREIANRGHEL